jgi:hypothetical protein
MSLHARRKNSSALLAAWAARVPTRAFIAISKFSNPLSGRELLEIR